MILKRVIVNLSFEAIHNWPKCNIEDVSFLRDPHRHVFKIKAWKRVSHGDRETEIIMLKRQILGYLRSKYPDRQLGSKSCEQLALEILVEFKLDKCEVLEDGENGAEVERS